MLPDDADIPDGTIVEVHVPRTVQTKEPPSDDQRDDGEERVLQLLLKRGLLREIKRPPRTSPPGDRTPIHVKGKPLSEQVIEDRR